MSSKRPSLIPSMGVEELPFPVAALYQHCPPCAVLERSAGHFFRDTSDSGGAGLEVTPALRQRSPWWTDPKKLDKEMSETERRRRCESVKWHCQPRTPWKLDLVLEAEVAECRRAVIPFLSSTLTASASHPDPHAKASIAMAGGGQRADHPDGRDPPACAVQQGVPMPPCTAVSVKVEETRENETTAVALGGRMTMTSPPTSLKERRRRKTTTHKTPVMVVDVDVEEEEKAKENTGDADEVVFLSASTSTSRASEGKTLETETEDRPLWDVCPCSTPPLPLPLEPTPHPARPTTTPPLVRAPFPCDSAKEEGERRGCRKREREAPRKCPPIPSPFAESCTTNNITNETNTTPSDEGRSRRFEQHRSVGSGESLRVLGGDEEAEARGEKRELNSPNRNDTHVQRRQGRFSSQSLERGSFTTLSLSQAFNSLSTREGMLSGQSQSRSGFFSDGTDNGTDKTVTPTSTRVVVSQGSWNSHSQKKSTDALSPRVVETGENTVTGRTKTTKKQQQQRSILDFFSRAAT